MDFKLTEQQKRFFENPPSPRVFYLGRGSGRTAAMRALIAATAQTPEDAAKALADLSNKGSALMSLDGRHVPAPEYNGPWIHWDEVSPE